jgi:hypothetical protein
VPSTIEIELTAQGASFAERQLCARSGHSKGVVILTLDVLKL